MAMLSLIPSMPLPPPTMQDSRPALVAEPMPTPPQSELSPLPIASLAAEPDPDFFQTAQKPPEDIAAPPFVTVPVVTALPMFTLGEPASFPIPEPVLQQVASASIFAPALPEQPPEAPAPSNQPPVSVREMAFLTGIEPNGPFDSPPVPKAVRSDAVIVPAVASSVPTVPAVDRLTPPDIESDAPFAPNLAQTALPLVLAPLAVRRETALPMSIAKVDPDALTPTDLQATPLAMLDRPASVPPAVTISMPPSVPAALVAQAPQAALGPVEVVLNPEELGKVRFEIHQHGDQVKVVLTVERPETLDLLRRHADQLVQEFRAAGYSGASLSFGHWGGQQGQKSTLTGQTEPDSNVSDATRSAPPPSLNLAPSRGLNLRL